VCPCTREAPKQRIRRGVVDIVVDLSGVKVSEWQRREKGKKYAIARDTHVMLPYGSRYNCWT
jgi:hypothetical protein